MFSHKKNHKGYNLPPNQIVDVLNDIKHETIMIPSSNVVTEFGQNAVFDIREKGIILEDLVLYFNINSVQLATNELIDSPRLNTSFLWFNRIEIFVNGVVLETLYPIQNFLLYNLFLSDEKRKLINESTGTYNDTGLRFAKTFGSVGTTKDWYLPIWSLFKSCKIPLLNTTHDIQIRVYLDELKNNIMGAGTNYNVKFNFVSLIAKVTRMSQQMINYKSEELSLKKHHYKYNEIKRATYSFTNPSALQKYTFMLSPLQGKVNFLFFYINRLSGTYSNKEYQLCLCPLNDFQILDSSSKNIVGGQLIPDHRMQNLLSQYWFNSTFLLDYEIPYQDVVFEPHVYMWSFCEDPSYTLETGVPINNFEFTGNEQLQITNSNNTFSNTIYKLEVFAFCENMIEASDLYIKKLTK